MSTIYNLKCIFFIQDKYGNDYKVLNNKDIGMGTLTKIKEDKGIIPQMDL